MLRPILRTTALPTLAAADWYERCTSRAVEASIAQVAAARRASGTTISILVPARNEVATIGRVVETLVALRPTLVDEVIVIDDDSTDGTATAARHAGAIVDRTSDLCPDGHGSAGKGDALWRGVQRASGDLVVFVDADLVGLRGTDIAGMVWPLVNDPTVQLVKGFHKPSTDQRPAGGGGGRVTELLARPLLNLWWPELAGVVHPLSGQTAARRRLLTELSLWSGYAIELAMLVDTYERYGLQAIAQVGLSITDHRHRDLAALSRTAYVIAQVAARRAGLEVEPPATYLQAVWRDDRDLPVLTPSHVVDLERPLQPTRHRARASSPTDPTEREEHEA